MKKIGGCNWIFEREILSDDPVLFFSELQLNLLFNKISRFLKIEKSSKIFLNISPSPFASLEKIVFARVFKV
jgi:hypothetical protein